MLWLLVYSKVINMKDLNCHNKYVIQYELESMQEYLKYKKLFAQKLQTEHSEKFGNNCSVGRSIFDKKNKIDLKLYVFKA